MFSFFQTKKDPLKMGSITKQNFTQTLNFNFKGGVIFIDIFIDNRNFTFLFDTGAMSVISTSIVKELTLLPLESALQVIDANGTYKETKLYTLPSLKLAQIEFKNFSVIGDDFSKEFPLSCLEFDGIIGYNFFQNLLVKIDYIKQELTISDRPLKTESYVKTRLKVTQTGLLAFKLKLKNKKLWIGVDSGKNSGLMIGDIQFENYCKTQNYEVQRTIGTFSSSFNGLNKHSFIDTYLLKNFSIDDQIQINSFPCTYEENALNIAGNEFLKNFNIIIDFRKKYIYFQKLKHENIVKTLSNSFGLISFWSQEKKLYIAAIIQGSPAYHSKLKIGDKIMSINDLDTLEFSQEEYCKHSLLAEKTLLYKENDTKLNIIVKRDEKLIREQLSLFL